MHPLIETHRRAIADLCLRYGVRRLELFGSILRQDFDTARSDVDVLVEYRPEGTRSFADFLDLKEALEQLFGRPVDLVEPHTIRNRRLRHYIELEKSLIYAAA
ncbi:MAG: nucleotidyltransferase family protein [Panacagrimonas sp.]